MLTYMLDTNICIHVMKNYPLDLREKFNSLAEQLCISSITLRAVLEHAGTPCGPHDMQIGGHARSEGLIIVTNNMREFVRMPGIRAENWV